MLTKLLNPANRIFNLFILTFALTCVSCQKDDLTYNGGKDDGRIESSVVKDISVINELVIPYNVKTQKFRIKSDHQWQIKLPDATNWVSITPLFGNEGESVLTISVARNDSPEERSAAFELRKSNSGYYPYEKYNIVQCSENSDENGFFGITITGAGSLEAGLNRSDIGVGVDKITRLRIEGSLNDDDFHFIQNELKSLVALDLEKATVSNLPPHFFCYTPVQDITLPERLSSVENLFYKYPDGGGLITGSEVRAVRISKNSPITTIPDQEFEHCGNLKYITLPDGLKSIGHSAFQYSYRLKQISLPEGLTEIGSYAFWCSGIKEIALPKSLQTIGSNAFNNGSLEIVTLSEGSKLIYIGANAFDDNYNLKEFYFPQGLKEIRGYAFRNTKLKNVYLPNTVQYIGDGAFADTPLESINIPADCQFGYPFSDCLSPMEVTIEGDLYSNLAPYLHELTRRVEFSKAVTTIHRTLLNRCTHMTEITLLNPVPPSVMYSNLYSPLDFSPNVSRSKCILKVPRGASSAYKADRIWGTFENIVEL